MEINAKSMREYAKQNPWLYDTYEDIKANIANAAYYGRLNMRQPIPEKVSEWLEKEGFYIFPLKDVNQKSLISWDDNQTCIGAECAYCNQSNKIAQIFRAEEEKCITTDLFCDKEKGEPVYAGAKCPLVKG